jgi:hypothetical protein
MIIFEGMAELACMSAFIAADRTPLQADLRSQGLFVGAESGEVERLPAFPSHKARNHVP